MQEIPKSETLTKYDSSEKKLEIFENDIDLYINIFCEKYNITDLSSETQNRFTALCSFIGKNVFTNSKDILKTTTTVNTMKTINNNAIINIYDYDIIDNILDIYINICNIYSKEISLNGFSKFINIDYFTLITWKDNKLNNKPLYIIQKLQQENERSNSDMLGNTKVNQVGIIARLNHNHKWSAQESASKVAAVQAINNENLPSLSLAGEQNQLFLENSNKNSE